MPIKADSLELSPHVRMLLMSPPKLGKTTHAVETSPGPVRVLLCEDDSALLGARRQTRNFEFERVTGWNSMMKYVVEAKRDAKDGKLKTLIVDPITMFADNLLEECFVATKTKEGNEDGRKAHPEFTKRILHIVTLLLTIPAHVIVIAHYMDTGGDDDTKKLGAGLMPLMPNTASRTKLAAMFYNVVWMDLAKPGQPEYRNRTFITSPDGCWGPGCRSLASNEKLPAHVGEFIKAMNSDRKSAKVNGAAVPKPVAGKPLQQVRR